MDWSNLESTLDPVPTFYVEAPDGRKDWAEIDRQVTLRKLLRAASPRLVVFANANAGKRNPVKAKREGIMAGVFDLSILWLGPQVCYVEMKGYDARGRAGKLSPQQIEFGNRCDVLGIPCACFFSPYAALDWLRQQGLPIAEVRHAA